MPKSLREHVEQILRMSVGADRLPEMHLAVMEQPFPEAMFTDEVVDVDVRCLDSDRIVRLTHVLINNDFAVERVMPRVGIISHLRIWSLEGSSACRRQREALMDQVLSFNFVDGWQWHGGSDPDPRDLIFQLPRRLEDERTWAIGVNFGRKDGGPHSNWDRGTLIMTFADRKSTEVTDVALYRRNGNTFYRMEPGKSFVRSAVPPIFF